MVGMNEPNRNRCNTTVSALPDCVQRYAEGEVRL